LSESSHFKELLNYATRIGVQAKFEGTEKAQMENLLASLEMVEDPESCLLVTAAYAHRQSSRGRIGWRTARLINEAMNWLYKQDIKKEEKRVEGRKLLGLAKWIYECLEKERITLQKERIKELTLEEFLEKLRG